METLVTKPIENRVSQVSGIKTLSSTVLEGYSETVLEFNIGVDPQVKASEVREKVASVRKALPDDILLSKERSMEYIQKSLRII